MNVIHTLYLFDQKGDIVNIHCSKDKTVVKRQSNDGSKETVFIF